MKKVPILDGTRIGTIGTGPIVFQNNSIMKLMKAVFVFACFIILSAHHVCAGGYSEDWSYVFHLQYKQGLLSIQEGVKDAYDVQGDSYGKVLDPAVADYYGVIINFKKAEVFRFGFNKPTTPINAIGRSVFDVKALMFADADFVSFYAKGGTHLFDISLKGSSFCNDDNKCNSEVGEDYRNCPNDCPAPRNKKRRIHPS